MTNSVMTIIASLVAIALLLQWWRQADDRALDNAWKSLVANVDEQPALFEPGMVADLPEPARRFFNAVIKPGTPIRTVAEVSMQGQFSLGTQQDPAYMPMRACQLLAPPFGFYWKVKAGNGLMRFSGSDGAANHRSWTRFWLLGMAPIVRMGNSTDHARSSFGRYMGDALFWVPGAFLPSESVTWTLLGSDSARVTVKYGGLSQAYDLTVDDAGRPVKVGFQRWSDANPSKTYRLQPFGGYLSDYRQFDGYWLPRTIVAGNHFETDAYFPFFKANVDRVRFIERADSKPQCQS